MKERGREYYHSHKDRQLPLALVRRRKYYWAKRRYINKVKDIPCADCSKKYPYYVMDFDHKNPRSKINDIAFMVRSNWSLKRIKKEVAKCEVVSANCHRIRTFAKQAEVAKLVTAGL